MKPVVRMLPVSEKYTLVSSHHAGGLENAICCQNCERLIVEIAIIRDSRGNSFPVGMDCAATLSGITPFDLSAHESGFADAKSMRSRLLKSRKANPEGRISVLEYGPNEGFFKQGGFVVTFEAVDRPGYFSRNLPEHLKPYIFPVLKAAGYDPEQALTIPAEDPARPAPKVGWIVMQADEHRIEKVAHYEPRKGGDPTLTPIIYPTEEAAKLACHGDPDLFAIPAELHGERLIVDPGPDAEVHMANWDAGEAEYSMAYPLSDPPEREKEAFGGHFQQLMGM